ncbi:hypothetical protein ID866_7289 [Astraeus odoratus]|nr:hypothetical protein ID866_7289 [Astraeus odoratus]
MWCCLNFTYPSRVTRFSTRMFLTEHLKGQTQVVRARSKPIRKGVLP